MLLRHQKGIVTPTGIHTQMFKKERRKESEMVERKNVPGPSKACDTAELIAGRVIQKNNAKSGADVQEGRSNAGWRRCEEA